MEYTLAKFIASRRRVENVAADCPHCEDLLGMDVPGFVYGGDMPITIQRNLAGEVFNVLILSDEYEAPATAEGLQELERRLYLFYIWECTGLGHLVERGAMSDDLAEALAPVEKLIGETSPAPAALFFSAPGRSADDWRDMNEDQRHTLLTAYIDAAVMAITPAAEKSEAGRIADRFATLLRTAVGEDNMREIVARNDYEQCRAVCHSHDFCDANVYMAAAFQDVTGREINCASQMDADLWNEAWDRAKSERFGFDHERKVA